MPKYYDPNVRPNERANYPAYPIAVPPVLPDAPPEGYPAVPYPGDLTAGDGAARTENLKPTTSASTNIEMPDNTAPPSKGGSHGLGVF